MLAGRFERDESANELGSVISVSCLDVYLGKDTVTLMVSHAKYDLLNHAVNLLCGLFSSSNVQWPSQHYTTTHFCCFLKKNTMPSIFNLFFFFLFLGLSKDIGTQCTLCVSCGSGGNVKSKSNEVSGSQIVDWCTNATIFSFLEFHVGRTKGRQGQRLLFVLKH